MYKRDAILQPLCKRRHSFLKFELNDAMVLRAYGQIQEAYIQASWSNN